MSSRLRKLSYTKISFFAFQDIITSVSGILILVTLLLATELDRPSNSANNTNIELERKLSQVILDQTEVDSRNRSLIQLLLEAETAPEVEKLEADITRLKTQLTDNKIKYASISEQLEGRQSALEARDRILGLTTVKRKIDELNNKVESIAREQAIIRKETTVLEQRVADVQLKILKLREREGKLWLIPDKSLTTKEPILTTVSGKIIKLERFDHPDQIREFNKSNLTDQFVNGLKYFNPLDQYIVFLIRPSGIELFEKIVKIARDKGFDVGFDAIEEDREILFSTPPSIDASGVQDMTSHVVTNTNTPTRTTDGTKQTNTVVLANTNNSVLPMTAKSKSTPPPKPKSWWHRFLEFIGLR